MRNFEINEDFATHIGKMIGTLHSMLLDINCKNRYCYDEKYIDQIKANLCDAFQKKHINNKHYVIIDDVLSKIRTQILNKKEIKMH